MRSSGASAPSRAPASVAAAASPRRSAAALRPAGATATAYLTGTGASVGALMLATGHVRDKGVIPPEMLDPEIALPMIRERGIEVLEHVAWEPSGT